jgi:hypothetical protein
MKLVCSALFFLALVGTAEAGGHRLRFADAAADACVANCSTQAASCRRVCPSTFNTPCLSACDNQAETCRRGCRAK